ncbi:hypothetical protein ACLQ9O_10335, partial [Ornithobacterium rhinotracheale]
LSGSATDPENDELFYTWEESDSAEHPITKSSFGPNNSSGAMTRAIPPSTSPNRMIPKLENLLNGSLSDSNPGLNSSWETVSNIARELNFNFIVRDRYKNLRSINPSIKTSLIENQEAGNIISSNVKLKILSEAGPFKITSQNTQETIPTYQSTQITWNVANTNNSPINAKTVSILYSKDRGNNFNYILAQNIENNGSANVYFTNDMISEQGRIMIKADNNIFLTINTADLKIVENKTTNKILYSELPSKGLPSINEITISNLSHPIDTAYENAFLKLESKTKPFIISRLSQQDLNKITQPADGMFIYNTDLKCFQLFRNKEWNCITPVYQ